MSPLPPLPRGTAGTTSRASAPSAAWATPAELGSDAWAYRPGRLFLGRVGGRPVGIDDDRHVLTVAGSRSGKSKSCLIPNLYIWPGSAVVIDPKGELAAYTAERRHTAGHAVHVLDPFREVVGDAGRFRSSFNPLDTLVREDSSDVPDDAALLAEALIVSTGGDSHWTDSAKNLLRGLILFMLATGGGASLNGLRQLLRLPFNSEDEDQPSLTTLFRDMARMEAFDGIVAGVGASMSAKSDGEGRSIISTAIEQTAFLDGKVSECLDTSDFALADLKRRPMTIYLVLPASRMATHARWFRLMVSLTLAALERDKTVPPCPVLMVLEEFPQLGYMRQIEAAAGLMAGYGVKLWTVLQDLTQIKALYKDSWETFIGNAGVLQAFGNSDSTTLEYLSKRLGTLPIAETNRIGVSGSAWASGDTGERTQLRTVPLLAPFELALIFGRKTNAQLILMPDRPPAMLERVWFNDDMFGV